MSYAIKAITERTGIKPETLRSWESRYTFLNPARSPNGYRQYSDTDLQLLLRIKELLDEGHIISEAVERTRNEGLVHERPSPRERRRLGPSPAEELVVGFEQAGRRLDEAAFARLHARLVGQPLAQRLDEVLLPALRRLRWAVMHDDVPTSCRWFLEEQIRASIAAALQWMGPGGPDAGRAWVLGGPPGDRREAEGLGAQAVLRARGWRATWMGGAFQLIELSDLVREHHPELAVVVWDEMVPMAERHRWLSRLRTALGDDCTVAVLHPGGTLETPARGSVTLNALTELPTAR